MPLKAYTPSCLKPRTLPSAVSATVAGPDAVTGFDRFAAPFACAEDFKETARPAVAPARVQKKARLPIKMFPDLATTPSSCDFIRASLPSKTIAFIYAQ